MAVQTKLAGVGAPAIVRHEIGERTKWLCKQNSQSESARKPSSMCDMINDCPFMNSKRVYDPYLFPVFGITGLVPS